MTTPTGSLERPDAPDASKRIVMIDDHRTYLDALSLAFGIDGAVEVVGRSSCGETGVEVALELQPDLVLCDYRMPDGHSGIECAAQLRANGYDGQIMILTGFAAPNVLAEAAELDEVQVLSKDLPLIEIVELVSGVAVRTSVPNAAEVAPPVILQRLRRAALLAPVVAIVALALTGTFRQPSPEDSSRVEVGGVALVRPFAVVEGTANEVLVTIEIEGMAADSFVPSNLPTTLALDADAGREVRVTVENLSSTGTAGCSLGKAKQVVATDNTSSPRGVARCVAVLN